VTRSRCDRADRIKAAIDRLAALIPFGALQADTDPAGFLDTVAEELRRLRPPLHNRDGSRTCWTASDWCCEHNRPFSECDRLAPTPSSRRPDPGPSKE
jgi:hypothetical protein